MPSPTGVNRPALVVLAFVAVIAGAIIWDLPWDRWQPGATLWLVPLALILIALHNCFCGVEGFRYPIFFFVTFAWIGVVHPPRTAVKFLPLLAAAYVLPLLGESPRDAVAMASSLYVLPICALVGEAVAWMAQRARQIAADLDRVNQELEHARTESQHRADLLAIVARAGGSIASLRTEEVFTTGRCGDSSRVHTASGRSMTPQRTKVAGGAR
jgi:hypothetical protein